MLAYKKAFVAEVRQEAPAEAFKDIVVKALHHEKASRERMIRVEGTLLKLNDELFPNLPFIAEKLSLFVNWKGGHSGVRFDLSAFRSSGRNVFLGPVQFADSKGNIYNWIDIKGVGMTKAAVHDLLEFPEIIQKRPSGEVSGLFDSVCAIEDFNNSNLFISRGIRVPAPVAIIKPKGIVLADGRRVSIEKLQEDGIIPRKITYDGKRHDFVPALYVRAFSDVMRLEGAGVKDMLDFAKKHGMDADQYCEWWINGQAENLAKMHDLGKMHNNLILHNLTLDARIVDFDTVKDASRGPKYKRLLGDIKRLARAASHFAGQFSNIRNADELLIRAYFRQRENLTKADLTALHAKVDPAMDLLDPIIRHEIEGISKEGFG